MNKFEYYMDYDSKKLIKLEGEGEGEDEGEGELFIQSNISNMKKLSKQSKMSIS